jgi:L-fuconolactonase
VAGIDGGCSDPQQRVAALAAQGVAGLRLRATDRTPGSDPLAIWRAADRFGLPVSVVGRWPDLTSQDFSNLLHQLPALVVVLEHLGSGPEPDATAEDRAGRARVFELARFPAVHIKIPGLGEFARRSRPGSEEPFERPIPPYLADVHAGFGAARMMWGSDFPPVAAREGYGNALAWCRAEFAGLPEHDVEAIFGGTAARVFGIETQAEIP